MPQSRKAIKRSVKRSTKRSTKRTNRSAKRSVKRSRKLRMTFVVDGKKLGKSEIVKQFNKLFKPRVQEITVNTPGLHLLKSGSRARSSSRRY
jgi:hypothetical protein